MTIEHVRKMFKVANLKERTILSLAVDLGLRISDFLSIKKTDLPDLDGEAPIAFDLLAQKEKITAKCFLSQESINLLKTYLPTIQKKKNNVFLFASNGKTHVSDESIGKMLKKLAAKAQINLNGKSLTFHCFRKMFLSASIDSGIGLTAGKLMCGKAVKQSDSTYLTVVKLREKFIQLKRFLSINEQTRIETKKIESFEKTINHLQEQLTSQKIINETEGIIAAFIYGSFASGEETSASDVDLCLIVNNEIFDEDMFISKINDLEKSISREVNYIYYSEDEWKDKIIQKDSFIESIKTGQKIILKGDDLGL